MVESEKESVKEGKKNIVSEKINVGQFDDIIELAAQGKNSKGKLFELKSQQRDAQLEALVAKLQREHLVSFQRERCWGKVAP